MGTAANGFFIYIPVAPGAFGAAYSPYSEQNPFGDDREVAGARYDFGTRLRLTNPVS